MKLEMRHITRQFPGVRALDDVSFDIASGEVHCLVGGNGAGKSTLMRILSGADQADAGTIALDGKTVTLQTPFDAQQQGISTVHQDPYLAPALSVADNILLGHEPMLPGGLFIDRDALTAQAAGTLRRLGESIPVESPVSGLGPAGRQIVALAQALSRSVRILVLDEPTASLTDRETQNLFRIIRSLRDEGVGIIYISHRLQEVFEIGDRLTVLRDGKHVTTCRPAELSIHELIHHMLGRTLDEEFPVIPPAGNVPVLSVKGLSSQRFRDISFTLHGGEVVGLAGLAGSGRTEIVRALFGADPVTSGRIVIEGKPVAPRSPLEAIAQGIGLLTEDRNEQGLFFNLNIRENISIGCLSRGQTGLLQSGPKEQQETAPFIDRLGINASPDAPVWTLSGGNRQKVVLARWLFTRSRVLLFDEPTVGIDVNAKFEIYCLIRDLAAQGAAILLISSDFPELLGLCHRIIVLREGTINGEVKPTAADQATLLAMAMPE